MPGILTGWQTLRNCTISSNSIFIFALQFVDRTPIGWGRKCPFAVADSSAFSFKMARNCCLCSGRYLMPTQLLSTNCHDMPINLYTYKTYHSPILSKRANTSISIQNIDEEGKDYAYLHLIETQIASKRGIV